MAENQINIEVMGKYLVIISIKFTPGVVIFSFTEKEKQEEIFDSIKATGTLKQPSGTIPIASAYKATIEEEYKSKMQIVQPVGINLN
jgi:hypothetical protein